MSGTTELRPSACLSCGKMLEMATDMTGDAMPEPGNITVCFTCGHVMAFADDLSFRELTDDEMYEVAGDELILKMQKARGEVLGLHRHDWHETGRREHHTNVALLSVRPSTPRIAVYVRCATCAQDGFRYPESRVIYTWARLSKTIL